MKGSLQEKSGKYYAVLRVDGKQKWINLDIPTTKGNKRKANKALEELCMQYEDNPTMFNETKFEPFVLKWLESIKNNVDTITYEGYKQTVSNHIIPYFKKYSLQNITIDDIEKFYNYKAANGRLDGKKGGLSLRSIKLQGIMLNLIFKYAIREGLVKNNPCEYAKYPVSKIMVPKKEPSFYTVEQCNALLNIIRDTPLYNMVYITFIYGLRRSELMGLKWDAIDFNNHTISIKHTVVVNSTVVRKDKTKNASSKRVYPMLPDIEKLLLSMKEEKENNKKIFGNCYIDNEYVFVKADGSAYYPSYPSHELAKIIKNNNLPYIRWHDLRHSTASMLIEKGWHMKDIQDWLGHNDIGTTMNIYGHTNVHHKRDISQSLSTILR